MCETSRESDGARVQTRWLSSRICALDPDLSLEDSQLQSSCPSAGGEVPLRGPFEHALPLLKAPWKFPSTLRKSWFLDMPHKGLCGLSSPSSPTCLPSGSLTAPPLLPCPFLGLTPLRCGDCPFLICTPEQAWQP